MAQHVEAARERLAAGLFDVSSVLMTVKDASHAGRTWLRLSQSEKVDLVHTKAARRLLKRLGELGYKVRWELVMPQPGEGPEQRYSELVITWGRDENPALRASHDLDD
jgi:hypothetical protein